MVLDQAADAGGLHDVDAVAEDGHGGSVGAKPRPAKRAASSSRGGLPTRDLGVTTHRHSEIPQSLSLHRDDYAGAIWSADLKRHGSGRSLNSNGMRSSCASVGNSHARLAGGPAGVPVRRKCISHL